MLAEHQLPSRPVVLTVIGLWTRMHSKCTAFTAIARGGPYAADHTQLTLLQSGLAFEAGAADGAARCLPAAAALWNSALRHSSR